MLAHLLSSNYLPAAGGPNYLETAAMVGICADGLNLHARVVLQQSSLSSLAEQLVGPKSNQIYAALQ